LRASHSARSSSGKHAPGLPHSPPGPLQLPGFAQRDFISFDSTSFASCFSSRPEESRIASATMSGTAS